MTTTNAVDIVEVGPRDGYQGIKPFIPTPAKITLLKRLIATGLKRIEIGSFVSAIALPQLADTPEILAFCRDLPDIVPQVLVPNKKYGCLAIDSGAGFLAFVLSVSESHNRSNVKRSPQDSIEEYRLLLAAMPEHIDVRLNLATAFDCPFEGRVAETNTIGLLDLLVPMRPEVELCLCDTTGRASPDQVGDLFAACMTRYPKVSRWAFHAHDTYGLGLANIYSAWREGVRVFDASFAGLGGCPFAPGATGNVATEDVAWMFRRMGISTGIDLDLLIPLACDGAAIPGATPGGRVRNALTAIAGSDSRK